MPRMQYIFQLMRLNGTNLLVSFTAASENFHTMLEIRAISPPQRMDSGCLKNFLHAYPIAPLLKQHGLAKVRRAVNCLSLIVSAFNYLYYLLSHILYIQYPFASTAYQEKLMPLLLLMHSYLCLVSSCDKCFKKLLTPIMCIFPVGPTTNA